MKLLKFLNEYIDAHTDRQRKEDDPNVQFFLGGGLASLHALRDMVSLLFPNTVLEWNGDNPDNIRGNNGA